MGFRGASTPAACPYYRRNTGTPIFLSIRLNMKDHPDDPNASRFRLPSYLISSNQIDLALADLFGPATTASRRDFDSLMVPFLCVASDMNTRRPWCRARATWAKRSVRRCPFRWRSNP